MVHTEQCCTWALRMPPRSRGVLRSRSDASAVIAPCGAVRPDEQGQPFGPSNPRLFVEGDWGQSLDNPKQNDAVDKRNVAVDWSRYISTPGVRKADVTVLCVGLRSCLSDSMVRLGYEPGELALR